MAWCPMTVTDEPRWIGGYASMRQGVYIIAGLITEWLLVKATHAPLVGAVMLGVTPGSVAYFFGWQQHPKTHEYMDRSLLRWWRYRRQTKVFLYRRRTVGGQQSG